MLFLCGFIIGFLVVYAFSPFIFKTKICCGSDGNKAGQMWLEFPTSCAPGMYSLTRDFWLNWWSQFHVTASAARVSKILVHFILYYLVHLGLSAVAGFVLGILSLKLYRFGVFAVGQCLGLIVALSVLCTPLHNYFDSNITYGLFMATSCCVFGSLSYKYEKPIVVITTASGGSLAFLYGKAFFYIYFVIPLM